MDKDKQGYIRFLFKQSKASITQISRETGVSRKTVRRLLREEKQKNKIYKSKLDPYRDEIKNILSEKPAISNVLILERLKEVGYTGQRTILGDYLLLLRGKRQHEAYLNIETLPGREAQADWACCGEISCGVFKRKLYMFCMVLSYSRYLYIEFTVSMNMSSFLCCHINAFNYFGAIPQNILYDNLKSVVKSRYGKNITYNGQFLDFAAWYGFNPKACNIRAGNEKGKVERAIQYVKNNFISGYQYDYPDKSGSFEHIKSQSMIWLNKTANQREHSVSRKIPYDCFLSEEKEHLLPLAGRSYDYAEIEAKTVSKDCLVKFETNRYSVPSEYAGQIITIKAYTRIIKFYLPVRQAGKISSDEIARHNRCYDKHCVIKNPDHYKELLNQKRKARQNSQREIFIALCPEAKQYLEGLNRELSNLDFHVEKILLLAEIYGKTATAGAIARANEYKAYGWEFIKNILLRSGTPNPAGLTNLLQRKELLEIEIEAHDLSSYDNENTLFGESSKGVHSDIPLGEDKEDNGNAE